MPSGTRRSAISNAASYARTHSQAFLTATIATVALCVTLLNRPGEYIDDFRFEVAWAPTQTLERVWSLWQSSGGYGGVAGTDRSLLPTLVFWLAEAFGAPPWIAQRIWHALLLFLAGTGCVMVVRFFRPRVGLWHLVSGLTYMFSPVGLGLFRPSPIYAVFAVAPWIVASMIYGSTGREPWRWAGVFALAVTFVAPIEVPGTLYVLGLLPLLGLTLVHLDLQATKGSLAGWALRAGALTTATMAAVLIRTAYAQNALERRLFITESPEAVAAASSWSEVFRGLGNWLTYFRFGFEVPRPNFVAFLENPVVVIATLIIPLVALSSVIGGGARAARAAVALAGLSLLLVVGLHPVDDPTPGGRLLAQLFERRPSSQVFRNTQKAAWLWALVVSVLFGGVLSRVGGRRRGLRWLPTRAATLTVGLALVVAASWPVWSGNLYSTATVDAVPEYWSDAFGWLNADANEGLVLILPGTPAAKYRWGDPGDDIFEAFLRRPYLAPNFFATSTATSTNLLSELQQRLNSQFLGTDSIGPILRRLGVRYVVIRNDLLWNGSSLPRPIALDPIRADPSLELVASFGAPGRFTTSLLGPNAPTLERSLHAFESGLSPVEIYDVGPVKRVRAVRLERSLILAGDGAGWFRALAAGLLDDDTPISYADALDDDDLITMLDAGSAVLVTDTNVRRELKSTGSEARRSPALFDVASDAFTDVLFDAPGAATTLWTADADNILSDAESLREPSNRAPQAFDGDVETAWKVPALFPRVGQSLTIELKEPAIIGQVEVVRSGPVTSGFISIDGGNPIGFEFTTDRTEVNLQGIAGQSITVGIDAVDPSDAAGVGFAEVSIAGVDLEVIRNVPSRLADRAASNAELAESLRGSSMTFAFERNQNSGGPIIESVLRRRLTLDTVRTFSIRGRLNIGGGRAPNFDVCVPLFRIDGRQISARVVPDPSGDPSTALFSSCGTTELAAGPHVIEAEDQMIDSFVLVDDATQPRVGQPLGAGVRALRREATALAFRVSSTAGARVVTGIAFHKGWSASIEGQPVRTTELDGQLAVVLREPGTDVVELRFGPQSAFNLANWVTVGGLLVSGALVIRPSAVGQVRHRPHQVSVNKYSAIAQVLVVAGLAYLAGGRIGVGVALGTTVIGHRYGWRLVLGGGLVVLVLGAALTITEAPLEASLQFATERSSAALATQVGLVIVAAASFMSTRASIDAPTGLVSNSLSADPSSRKLITRLRAALPSRSRREIVKLAGLGAVLISLGAAVMGRLPDSSADLAEAAQQLRSQVGYASAVANSEPRVAAGALGTMAEAFGPSNLATTAALILLAAVFSSVLLPSRRFVLSAATLAVALVVGSSPTVVLAVALLSIGIATLALPSMTAAVLAGAITALAGLAAPEATLVAPVVLTLASSRANWWPHGILAIGTGVAGSIAWWRWADREMGLGAIGEAIEPATMLLLLLPVCAYWLLADTSPQKTGGRE